MCKRPRENPAGSCQCSVDLVLSSHDAPYFETYLSSQAFFTFVNTLVSMAGPTLGKTLPKMAVFGRSAVVSPAFKKQFYEELQTPFLIENNNKNNRTMETKQ